MYDSTCLPRPLIQRWPCCLASSDGILSNVILMVPLWKISVPEQAASGSELLSTDCFSCSRSCWPHHISPAPARRWEQAQLPTCDRPCGVAIPLSSALSSLVSERRTQPSPCKCHGLPRKQKPSRLVRRSSRCAPPPAIAQTTPSVFLGVVRLPSCFSLLNKNPGRFISLTNGDGIDDEEGTRSVVPPREPPSAPPKPLRRPFRSPRSASHSGAQVARRSVSADRQDPGWLR